MDFDDHEDQEEEEMDMAAAAAIPPGYHHHQHDSLGNSARPKIGTGEGASTATAATTSVAHTNTVRKLTRYRECLKNHAVNIGRHAVDGCGEFIAAGDEGTLDALKCAACNCHRNFHRKETDENMYFSSHQASQQHHSQFSPYYRAPPPSGYLHHLTPQHRPPLALPAASGGGGGDGGYSREDEDMSNPSSSGGGGGGGGGMSGGGSKKRFRTKFSQEQKDKMLAFAERLGWRIQKHDEASVEQFCAENGIKRHVLKVWMHNNKHTLASLVPICQEDSMEGKGRKTSSSNSSALVNYQEKCNVFYQFVT